MATATDTTTQRAEGLDRLSESAHAAVDRATRTASQVAERFGEKSDELAAVTEDYVAAARDYVKENPLTAVGIALAAGYLFGKITSWR